MNELDVKLKDTPLIANSKGSTETEQIPKETEGQSVKPTIFAGMTIDDAKESGGDILDIFNQYNTDNDAVLSEEEFEKYKTDNNISLSNDSNESSPQEADSVEIKNNKIELGTYRIQKIESSFNATNALLSGYVKPIKPDIEEANKEVQENTRKYKFSTEKERLRKNEFNDYERNVLHLQENMSEEELDKQAEIAVQYSYLAYFSNQLKKAKEDNDQEEIKNIIQNLQTLANSYAESGNRTEDIKRIEAIISVYAITNIEDDTERQQYSDIVASYAEMNNIDEEVNYQLSSVIMENSSEEAIEKFVINNIEYENVINETVQAIIENKPEILQKIDLKNVIEKSFAKAEEMGIERPSKRTNISADNKSTKTTVSTENKTSPLLSAKQQTLNDRINNIKQASAELYTPVVNDIYNNKPDTNVIKSNIEEFGNLIPTINKTTNPIARAQLKKDITQHFESIIKDFENIEQSDKEFIHNHLSQASNDTLYSMFLRGSNKARIFIKDYINMNALFHYLETHPAEKKTASPEILEEFNEYMTEQYKS